MQPIRPSPRGVLVDILVQPNASRAEVVGLHGDRVKVRVTVAPRRLAANEAVVDLLTSVVGVRRGEVVAGITSRAKTIELVGADVDEAMERLLGP